MTYWLINLLTDWLTDWLTSWFLLINGLINWLAEWLILADWLTGWMTDWLAKWQSVSNWLIDWLTDYLTDWLTDWRTVILIDWLTYNWLTQMTQTSDWTSKTHFSLFCANGQRPKEGDWQIRTLTRHTCTYWRCKKINNSCIWTSLIKTRNELGRKMSAGVSVNDSFSLYDASEKHLKEKSRRLHWRFIFLYSLIFFFIKDPGSWGCGGGWGKRRFRLSMKRFCMEACMAQ